MALPKSLYLISTPPSDLFPMLMGLPVLDHVRAWEGIVLLCPLFFSLVLQLILFKGDVTHFQPCGTHALDWLGSSVEHQPFHQNLAGFYEIRWRFNFISGSSFAMTTDFSLSTNTSKQDKSKAALKIKKNLRHLYNKLLFILFCWTTFVILLIFIYFWIGLHCLIAYCGKSQWTHFSFLFLY